MKPYLLRSNNNFVRLNERSLVIYLSAGHFFLFFFFGLLFALAFVSKTGTS